MLTISYWSPAIAFVKYRKGSKVTVIVGFCSDWAEGLQADKHNIINM
jgi:hypothetical protein